MVDQLLLLLQALFLLVLFLFIWWVMRSARRDLRLPQESFFIRHAYFLGQNDPYDSLKITLKTEIDAETWAMLNSDISRPFPAPKSGRIAIKIINHLGDEVMKVFKV